METYQEKTSIKTDVIKKVLIALDYNSNSNEIAKIGHQLAKKIGAETILIHIISDEFEL